MVDFLRIVLGEIRRELMRARAYWLELLADQLLFTLGFLLLSGLFNLVAEGEYDSQARLASLIGYVIWRVADGCILRIVGSFSDDARVGTLEQVWLSAVSPHLVLMARSIAILLYHSARGMLLIAVLVPLSGISIDLGPESIPSITGAALLIFVLAQMGAFGLAYLITGLHLVTKNVSAITLALSTALLFLTGALAPLDNAPLLLALSRALPLTSGIELSRQLFAGEFPVGFLWQQPGFYWLLLNTGIYLLLGGLVLEWGQRTARRKGTLAHY